MAATDSISTTIQSRQSRPVKWLLVALLVAGVAGAGLWQLGHSSHAVDAGELWTGRVKQGDFTVRLSGSGRVRPGGEAILVARQGGMIERIIKQPGEPVRQGDVLIQLSNANLEQELSRSRINLQQAQLEKQETTLNNLSERARALEAIQLARDKLQLSEVETRAKEDLFQRNIISRLDYEKQQMAHQQAKRALQSAQSRLQEQLEPLWRARLDLADARMKKAQLEFDEIKRRIDQLTVRANVDGTVVRYESGIKPGAQLNTGQEVGLVTDLSQLMVELKLPAQRADSLEAGMPVRLANAFGAFRGVIQRVFPSAENGRITVWVSLHKPYPKGLKLGMSVTGEVELERFTNALSLPRPMGVRERGTATVFVRQGDVLRPRLVEFGPGSVDKLLVKKGLTAGEEVVLSDTSAYAGAEKIRISE